MRITIESGTVTPARARRTSTNPFLEAVTKLADDLSGEPKRLAIELDPTGEDVVLSKRADGTEVLVDAAERTARRQIADAAKAVNMSADVAVEDTEDALVLYVALVERRRGGRPAGASVTRITDPASGTSNEPLVAQSAADGLAQPGV